MPLLNRNEKITFEICGTETKTLNLAPHQKRCSAGALFCTQCPNFFKKTQNDLNDHFAMIHNAPKADVIFKCNNFYQ